MPEGHEMAKKKNMHTMAKIQANCTWEWQQFLLFLLELFMTI